MIIKPSGQQKISIEIDTTEMTASQVRMIKTLNALLSHALVTESESEYFETSSEVMRLCASIIKQANFIEDMKNMGIPYAEQVLEYSMDVLHEHMANSKVISYDN